MFCDELGDEKTGVAADVDDDLPLNPVEDLGLTVAELLAREYALAFVSGDTSAINEVCVGGDQ
jgi:hypothetical protein